MEEELKDNTKYIEERRKINNELFDENKKTISEEVRIFKEGRQTEFDFNKLIIQQDEIKLKNAIDLIRTKQGHGLDAAGVVEIAKIIKQAQENEIANNKIINDLAKEEMKNMEKVADIKRDIATIKLVDELHDSNEVLKMREKAYETSNKNLLDKQNIWDFKMQRIREADFALIGSQLEDSYQLQKKVLTQKEKDAEIKANNTITDTKVLNAEILKLQTQLGIDIGNLETDQFYKEKDLNEKKRLDDKKLWNERLESEMAVMEQINQGIKAGLDKRAQLQQSSDQKEIDMHQRMIDVQARLASEGKANSLAEVEAQTAKAEEKKIQDAKKAAKLQETIAIAETFEKTLTKALESDKPFVQAFSEALASSGLVASTFTALAAGFKDGVEGLNGPGTETSDSIPAMLSKNESVINAKGTKQNPGLATAMNRGTVDEYFESVYLPNYNSSSSAPSIGSGFVHDEKLAYIIDKKFESLQRAIEGKPVPDISLDGLGEWTKKIREGNMTTIIHHLQSQKRPSLRRNG